MPTDFVVLGATGNTGTYITENLVRRGFSVTLAGRDPRRLTELAQRLGGRATTVVDIADRDSLHVAATAGRVLVNTVGPFARLAPAVLAACLDTGTSYVDIGNERAAVRAVFDLDEAARARGVTLVTGAGFGQVSTEAPLVTLLAYEPNPTRVIVAAAAETARQTEGVRTTVAETIADGATTYVGGELVRGPLGQNATVLTFGGRTHQVLPAPMGDLEAARRISGAMNVTAYITPPGEAAGPNHQSFGYAEITGADGTTRTAVLSTGEGVAFGVHVAAETATRLLGSARRPGAWTPIHLLGTDVATSAPDTRIEIGS
jgi:saccharopine dehydrogenase (NAD+, L-lysine-forming)